VQYSAASILMGSALFFVYALPAEGPGSAASLRWPRPWLVGAALVLAAATLFGLVAQTATLAGSLADALTTDSLTAVVTQMDFGTAAVARAALALGAAIYALAVPRGRALWLGAGVLGTFACATFGWMGHGGATEGGGHMLHLAADVLHALAAALWVGALAAFARLAAARNPGAERVAALATALERFSPLGIALVAVVAATGLVNGWYLVGTDVGAALHTAYGQLLALKLALFVGMLALAALHRQRSVPALAARLEAKLLPQADALASLRRSLAAEALLGFAVLALVAWFGTLAAPGSI
jgi:copper resistance protein D